MGARGEEGHEDGVKQPVERLDRDDPPVDMDAILSAAGRCPFESRRKKT